MKQLLLLPALFLVFAVNAQTNELLLAVRAERDLTDSTGKATFLKKGRAAIQKDSMQDNRVKKFALIRWKNKPAPEFNFAAGEVSFVHHQGYWSLMHNGYHIPVYVSHAIDAEKIEHPVTGLDRADGYPKDAQYPVLKKSAYASSGYDHGHLAPARDFKHDSLQYIESNNMTNMTPQHGCFNQKGWCYLESACRYWCTNSPGQTYYIASGPVLRSNGSESVFIDSLCVTKTLKVYVPRYFFKAILAYSETEGIGKAVGFIVPNTSVENNEIPAMYLSIDELERATGLNFFSYLPDNEEKAIEFKASKFDFSDIVSECPEKTCDKVYPADRVRPETRVKLRCE